MDPALQDYLTRLFEAWKKLIEPGPEDVRVRLAFFLGLVVLMLVVRGRRSWSVRATLGVLTAVVIVHLNFVVTPFLSLIVEALRSARDGLGVPRLPATVWVGVPGWVVALIAVVVVDFANYCNHRLMHTPLVWPMHSIHHSDPDVTGMTTFRVHALEGCLMSCSYVVLLGWLNLPDDAFGMLGVVLVLHNMYIHTDLGWTHGRLEVLIASPQYHRWHHADVPEAYGKNLANVIPLFDVVFGTYYNPGPCTAPMGAAGVPNDPFRLFLYPLVAWMRQLRGAVSALGRWTLARSRRSSGAIVELSSPGQSTSAPSVGPDSSPSRSADAA